MVSRYFFALYAVAMFAAVASVSIKNEPKVTKELSHSDSKDKLEETQLQKIADRALIDEIVRVLEEICTSAKNCLKDMTNQCKQYWLRPIQFLACVKEYVEENKEKCSNPGFSFIY